MVKAICLPSGAHSKLRTPLLTSVSCSASPPAARISQTFSFPERLEVNAIHVPSGDHRGLAFEPHALISGFSSAVAAVRGAAVRATAYR
jgi:hypothetical protein